MSVKIIIEVSYQRELITFERLAPELPASVTWHKGLFVDFGDEYDYGTVSDVEVNASGECIVRLSDTWQVDEAATVDIIKQHYIKYGWSEKSHE